MKKHLVPFLSDKALFSVLQRLIIFLATITLLISCRQPMVDSDRPQTPSVARLNLQSEPLSIDPRVGGNRTSQIITRSIFEGLMRLDQNSRPIEALAERISISDDKLVYRFTLRKSLWSNGDPVTAHDFEYAWKSLLDPQFATNFSYAFFVIKNARPATSGQCSLDDVGIKALDDYTLEVTLEHPTPYFLETVANPLYSPVHREIAKRNPNWSKGAGPDFVSNGPFLLESWSHQAEMKLARSNNYYDKDNVKLDGLVISFIEDAHSALSLYEKQELDWIGDPLIELPLDAIPTLSKKGNLKTLDIGAVYWMEFNTSHPLFSNIKVRQAFARAVNRREITDKLRQCGESPAYSILPTGLSLQDKPLFTDNDITIAQRLFEEGLKELGLTRDNLPYITISHSTRPGEKGLAETLQQQWHSAFNIPIRLRSVEWNVYFNEFATHQFETAGSAWFSFANDPIYNLEYIKYKDNGMNATLWENQEYIQLLDLADQETDQEKRNQYLKRAEQIALKEMPLVPLFYPVYKFEHNPALKGVVISNLGQIDFKWSYFEPQSTTLSPLATE